MLWQRAGLGPSADVLLAVVAHSVWQVMGLGTLERGTERLAERGQYWERGQYCGQY